MKKDNRISLTLAMRLAASYGLRDTALDTSDEWERMPGKQRTNEFGVTRCWVPSRR